MERNILMRNVMPNKMRNRLMSLGTVGTVLSSAIALLLSSPMPSWSLPGESVDDVANWIYTNPLLPDGRRGSLRVSRSDIPGQRFSFVASKTLPTQPGLGIGETRIRSEWIEVLDYTNGVSGDRLLEALRAIYGLDLYQDYRNAVVVYDYSIPPRQDGQDIRRGQVLQGDRFGYWLEMTERDGEDPVLGKLAVILIDDIASVRADLQEQVATAEAAAEPEAEDDSQIEVELEIEVEPDSEP